VKNHIVSEEVAKHNGILEHCMYCNSNLDKDSWKLEPVNFETYVSNTCTSCHREIRFKDKNIHTIEDLIERINKK